MKELITEFVKLPDNKIRMRIFKENFDKLKDWTIIIFNDNNKKYLFPDYLKTGKISNNFFNYSPFPLSDFFVFNKDSVQAYYRNEGYDFKINGAIELDTNILSYLLSFIKNGNKEYKEIFDYLIVPEHNSTINAYLNENYKHLDTYHEKIEEKIKAYEIMKHFDYNHYLSTNEKKSNLDEKALCNEVSISMAYIETIGKGILFKINKLYYDLIYCELLLMIIVEFSFYNNSLSFKIEKYITECTNKLGFIPEREIAIAKNYFIDRNLGFFSSIQKNNKKIFKKIEAMAWDLFHVHFTEKAVLFAKLSNEEIYFPSFLTRDKRLFDILKECKVKSYAYNSITYEFFPFYDNKKLVFPNKDYKITKKEHKELSRIYRNIEENKYKIENKKINLEIVKRELEQNIKDIFKI